MSKSAGSSAKRRGVIMATVANPRTEATKKKPRKSTKAKAPKAPRAKPKGTTMAAAKKGAKKSAAKKRPKRSNPSHSSHSSRTAHGTIVPRGMMLVPTGGGARNPTKRKKGRRPHRHNPAGEHLKNAAAAVGFGAAAATVGMLGGWALSKANLKNKWANVAVNVAAGSIAGGGLGLVDRTAGTIVAHNYMVAAGQWMGATDGASEAAQARSGVTPGMFAHATHGLGEEQPDPESITRALPPPQLSGYNRVDGLGSPLDHLGSPIDHLGAVLADNLGDDFEGYNHLDGILADNLGDELEALDDELGFRG